MAAGGTGTLREAPGGNAGVLRRLRAETADEHADVERSLDLLDPELTRPRLAVILDRMHAFWTAAEAGLDRWASDSPGDADAVEWPRRRRTALFATDLRNLGAPASAGLPTLRPVDDTDRALGLLYVLEGSTLGGAFIDRHLASLPQFRDVSVRAFSPYGDETGAMWAAFRRVTRARVAAGGDADAVVESARDTFGALAAWCGRVADAEVVSA
jgi:heme oxygenase